MEFFSSKIVCIILSPKYSMFRRGQLQTHIKLLNFCLPARVPSRHSKLKSFPGLRSLSLPVKSNTVRWLTNATSPAPSVRQRYAPWSPKYLSETLDGQVFRWKQIAQRLMGLLSSGLYFLERAPGEVQNGNVIVTQLFLSWPFAPTVWQKKCVMASCDRYNTYNRGLFLRTAVYSFYGIRVKTEPDTIFLLLKV